MTTANPASNGSEFTARLQGILLRQETILFFILIGGMAFMSFQSDVFLTPENLLNQGRLATEIALIALPMTLIIITGGIDLSVGSIVGLTAIMLGVAWENWGLPLEVAIGVALLIATACGAFNAFFIIRVGLPPLITTLATLALFRGLAEGIAQARSVRGYPEWFYILGQKDFDLFGQATVFPNQLFLVVVSIIAIRRCTRLDALRQIALCHRQQRDRGALQRLGGGPQQVHHLHAVRLHVWAGGLGLRLPCEHDPLRHGQRLRADRDHCRGRGWHEHLRRQRHHHRHRPRTPAHPAHEERPCPLRARRAIRPPSWSVSC